MKRNLLFIGMILITLLSKPTQAQEFEFDLKNYKNTDYKRTSLGLYFDLDESLSVTKSKENSRNSESLDSTFRLDFHFNPQYARIRSNRERIETIGAGFYFNGDNNNTSRDANIDTLNNSQNAINRMVLGLFGSYSLDLYQNKLSKHFLHLNSGIRFNSSMNSIESKQFKLDSNNLPYLFQGNNSSNYFVPLEVNLGVGYGYGRIEYVEDAVEAIYILNDLSESGKLIKPMNEAEISAFADRITQLKKVRYFDTRLYRKMVMKELLNFLDENNFIAEGDVDV